MVGSILVTNNRLLNQPSPTGSIPTCCSGTWPGPSGRKSSLQPIRLRCLTFYVSECALGTGCGTPSTSSTPSFIPAPIPDGWTQASSCAQDDGSRVLYNDVITNLSNNTPANCIAHCSASGYAFAGVEYGTECHCGTGFLPGTPDNIPQSKCNVPCTGDNSYSCGGSWAIQLYTGPTPTETLPDGWSLVRYCGVDEANRVIENDNTSILPNNTPATCIEHCIALGFDYAGVEYGDECHCGTGYIGGAQAPTTDCNIPCPGNPSLTCGGSWRIQLYSSEPQYP